jgi:hypothetical protein
MTQSPWFVTAQVVVTFTSLAFIVMLGIKKMLKPSKKASKESDQPINPIGMYGTWRVGRK